MFSSSNMHYAMASISKQITYVEAMIFFYFIGQRTFLQ